MSEVRNRRNKRAEAQPTLFDSKPIAKPAKTPAWVIRELVDKWGVPEVFAKSKPCNVAFAILYQHREGRPLTPERRQQLRSELADRLKRAAADDDLATRELSDICVEALQVIDCDILRRICAGLANVMAESPKPLSA